MTRWIPIVLLSFSVACGVPKADFEALQAQYDECEAKQSKLEASNQRLRDESQRREARAEARLQSLRELFDEFKPFVDRGILEVSVDGGRISIGMASDVLFAAGSAELSTDGVENVQQIAKILSKRSERDFQVEGHTDSDPIATKAFPSNWHLASARALTVLQTMVAAGMPAGQISAGSFGDTRAIVANDTPENKARNRRIEVVLLPDLSELPGYEQLAKLYEEKAGMKRRPTRQRPQRKPKPKPKR